MSRPILSRPRTRVYDCNYDKGESYYKPMVDHLDRKYCARPLFSEPRNSLADEIAARRSDIGSRDLAGSRNDSFGRDLDLEFEPRPRVSQVSSQPPPSFVEPLLLPEDEDTVYDSRGQRTQRRKFAEDFANEVSSTTRRIKARVAAMGLDDEVDAILNQSRRQRSELENIEGALGATTAAARRALQTGKSAFEEAESSFKRRSKFLQDEMEETMKPSLTRWSKLLNEDDEPILPSAAATRAKQTKARLNDLESEMEELAERQAKRERRAAALRALVNESVMNDEELQQSSMSSKKISMRSERSAESKHVTF